VTTVVCRRDSSQPLNRQHFDVSVHSRQCYYSTYLESHYSLSSTTVRSLDSAAVAAVEFARDEVAEEDVLGIVVA
jgi:hypothetical protein